MEKNQLIAKINPKYATRIVAGAALFGAFAFASVVLQAAVVPTVNTSIHNGSHSIVTSVSIGTGVHDTATVASSTGATPVGTVDFTVYPNTTCTGTGTTQAGVLLVSGVAESATTTVTNTGLSYKVQYNGQTDVYSVADGICEPLTVTSSSTTITGTLSSTTVYSGTSVFENSVLGNATANATGTVAYRTYTNNGCTSGTVNAGDKIVASAVVPNSNTMPFNIVGTFYFQAVYGGDMNNTAATSSCQSLTVLATTTSSIPPTPGTGSISGMVYNDMNKNGGKDAGETGLAGWTIKLYNGANFGAPKYKNPVMTTMTDVNGNYTFANLAAGTYSIEQIINPGWTQLTSDYKKVDLTSGGVITSKDFADASSTPKVNKGNHNGFFKKFNDHWKGFQKFFEHANKDGKDGKDD